MKAMLAISFLVPLALLMWLLLPLVVFPPMPVLFVSSREVMYRNQRLGHNMFRAVGGAWLHWTNRVSAAAINPVRELAQPIIRNLEKRY